MANASVDLVLATSAMIVIVVAAVRGVSLVAEAYTGVDDPNIERFHQIGRLMILSVGEPLDWGISGTPIIFGLAGERIFELEIDKVTRMNPSNAFHVDYYQLWESLGINDISFQISVVPLIDVNLSIISTQYLGAETAYTVETSSTKQGSPLEAELKLYIVMGDYISHIDGVTNSSGLSTLAFNLTNSMSGEALLICFARTGDRILGFDVLTFTHNAPTAPSSGFASMSPLNYTLNVSVEEGVSVVRGFVFSFRYEFNLTGSGSEYEIPRLLDLSPLILALTGLNGSNYCAAWVAYPQIPLDIGSPMLSGGSISDTVAASYMVDIKGCLYRLDIRFRSSAHGSHEQ